MGDPVEPGLRRPDPARQLPRRVRGADARPGRRRPDGDQQPDRLLRRELLQPDPRGRSEHAGAGGQPDHRGRPSVRDAPGGGVPRHRLRLAGRPRRAAGPAGHDVRRVRRAAATGLRHRERLRLQRRAGRHRPGRRPAPDRLPRRPPSRRGSGDRGRCGRPRVLHLEPDRQLRVGRGVHQALRPRARRLRDAEEDAEGLLRLVRADDRREQEPREQARDSAENRP